MRLNLDNINIYDFAESVERYINQIQNYFDAYQKSHFPERSPEFFCLELNGEAGELANAEKKNWKGKIIDKSVFEDESADVFIALMNYANARKIKLGSAIAQKLLKIEKIRIELAEKGEDY